MENNVKLAKTKDTDAEAIAELLTKVYESELATVFRGIEDKLFIPGHACTDMHRYRMRDGSYYKIMYKGQMAGIIRVDVSGREHGRLDLLYLLQDFKGKVLVVQRLSKSRVCTQMKSAK